MLWLSVAQSDEELRELQPRGLRTLYIGPESGDDVTLKKIAKGDSFAGHVEVAKADHPTGNAPALA